MCLEEILRMKKISVPKKINIEILISEIEDLADFVIGLGKSPKKKKTKK